ncbi:MAG: hypothetical protein J0H27_04665 [Xanthomonadales bacterium]|nr:hypothetical protein [Xanthomonadales bacterium]ODU93709.1 MAG: hypothetical protein ABT18_06665 [Rhodanobacter sp. SCN 66-43]OJY83326.1 MAG: hypothetical protein BGP23_09970 [Xanthomonadales bacterium 66-474]
MKPVKDASHAMLDALHASGPAQSHESDLMLFGQFVGSWSLDVIYYNHDGSVRWRTPGEWHFGWALEGRAIEDVWMVPPRSQRITGPKPAGEFGVTLRFYDPRLGAWRSTWHGPVNGYVLPFIAKAVGDEIVLERSENGEATRWIFGRIKPDSFYWRAVNSADGGKSWRLDQEMFATRVGMPPRKPGGN